MAVGAYGNIVFEVSSFVTATFDKFNRDTKARFAKHETIGNEPVAEYLGPDNETISFEMFFSTALGVDPASEAETIREMCKNGDADYLIIGNSVIGDCLWVITSVGESFESVDGHGRVIVSRVKVEMESYVEDVM